MQDLNIVRVLEPNSAFTFTFRGNIKRILGDYWKILEDFVKANVIELNNAFILTTCENVKRMLGDYQGTFKDPINIDVLKDVLEPNNTSTLRKCENVKKMLKELWKKMIKELWRTLTTLKLLDQTMHSLWTPMEMLKQSWKIIKEPLKTLTKFMFFN